MPSKELRNATLTRYIDSPCGRRVLGQAAFSRRSKYFVPSPYVRVPAAPPSHTRPPDSNTDRDIPNCRTPQRRQVLQSHSSRQYLLRLSTLRRLVSFHDDKSRISLLCLISSRTNATTA